MRTISRQPTSGRAASAEQLREERRYIRDMMGELPVRERTASAARLILRTCVPVEVYVTDDSELP